MPATNRNRSLPVSITKPPDAGLGPRRRAVRRTVPGQLRNDQLSGHFPWSHGCADSWTVLDTLVPGGGSALTPAAGGAALLDQLLAALTRYVILPSPEAADAIALWIAATHAQTAWEHATRLAITAPEKRCGKSRLLDIIEATCHDPLITVNISPAALARSVNERRPADHSPR